jgi:hypothetical protein
VLASRATGRDGAVADAEAWAPRLSADGRHVVFASSAGNLGAGRPAAGAARIFVRDLDTDATRLVSAGADGRPLPGFASEPVPSADGGMVAFSLAPPGALGAAGARGDRRRPCSSATWAPAHRAGGGRQGATGPTPDAVAERGRPRVAFAGDGGNGATASCASTCANRGQRDSRLVRAPTSSAAAGDADGARLCRLAPPVW